MSKGKTREYKRGKSFNTYINQTVDDKLLGFINKQSDLSGASLLGMIVLYHVFGDVDVADKVPRKCSIDSVNLDLNLKNVINQQLSEINVIKTPSAPTTISLPREETRKIQEENTANNSTESVNSNIDVQVVNNLDGKKDTLENDVIHEDIEETETSTSEINFGNLENFAMLNIPTKKD